MSNSADNRAAFQLCLLAAVNYLLFYGLGVFLARTLGIKGFGQYNAVVATFTLLSSVATLGLEKFSLRAFSSYISQKNWSYARGFARFSVRTILVVSVAIAIVYVMANWWATIALRPNPWMVVALLVVFIPSMSMVLFLVELLSANGSAIPATLVYRLLLPLGLIGFVGATYYLAGGLTTRNAVICYGAAWVLSFLVIIRLVRRSIPDVIWKAGDKYMPRHWLRRALPFFLQSFMMTQFANLGIIALKLLHPDDFEVGLYAASIQVASLAVLMATSTGRLYAPRISIYLDRRDWNGLKRLKRQRHAWVIPAVMAYLVTILLFGKRILGLYGPGFEHGYPALCILAAGVAVAVIFAMAPHGLQFAGKSSWVLGVITVAGFLNMGLLMIFGGRFGATGAAVAYSTSLFAMYVALYIMAKLWIRNQEESMPQNLASPED